jgi:hypothetical protein
MTDTGAAVATAAVGVAQLPADIRAFLDALRDAFNALDGAAVADLYAVPSAIAQGGVFTHWATREPIVQNMVALCALYASKGYVRAHFEPAQFLAQGADYAVADLLWRIDWAEGAPWLFNTTYNLVRTASGWRVLLCTAYTEDKLFASADAAG